MGRCRCRSRSRFRRSEKVRFGSALFGFANDPTIIMMQMRCQNVYPVVLRIALWQIAFLVVGLVTQLLLGLAVNSGNVAGAGG